LSLRAKTRCDIAQWHVGIICAYKSLGRKALYGKKPIKASGSMDCA
jgi:hypothetical protein